MQRVEKQRHGPFSALRRFFGSSARQANRARQPGDGFHRWLHEFELKNRASILESQAKYHRP